MKPPLDIVAGICQTTISCVYIKFVSQPGVNQPASWGVRILVYALDAMITIVGAIGPIALISIPLCLIADAF
jgi:hypothetical protein